MIWVDSRKSNRPQNHINRNDLKVNLYRFLINTLLIIYSLAEATEVATTGKTH